MDVNDNCEAKIRFHSSLEINYVSDINRAYLSFKQTNVSASLQVLALVV